MPEWLNLEWWRYAWGPLLAAGLIWLSTTWKTKSDARGGMDARLDGRMDRLLTAQTTEAEGLRRQLDAERKDREEIEADRDRWERLCRWWFKRCHDMAHALLSARWIARRERELAGKDVPVTWSETDELPPMEDPWPKSPA